MSLVAYDMSRFQRLILVEGPRVRGIFAVLLPSNPKRDAWVNAHDVTIYDDDSRMTGRVYYSGDMTGSVRDGVAALSPHMIASEKRDDALAAEDELLEAFVLAVGVAQATTQPDGGTR